MAFAFAKTHPATLLGCFRRKQGHSDPNTKQTKQGWGGEGGGNRIEQPSPLIPTAGTGALLPSSSQAKGISKAGNKKRNEFREILACNPLPAMQLSSDSSPWGDERKNCKFKWVPLALQSHPVQRGLGHCCCQHSCGEVKSCSEFFPLMETARVFVREWGKRELLLIPMSLTLMQQVNIWCVAFATGQLCLPETKRKCILGCQWQRFHWVFCQEGS